MSPNPPKIIGRECRFATHLPENHFRRDTHLVKEILHYDDGTTKPNLLKVVDFKRPYYLTNQVHRNHKQKKEREKLSNVRKYVSTESQLANNIGLSLGMHGYKRNQMRDVLKSPYLYGADVASTVLIKDKYKKNFPELNTAYSVCALDIETDIFDEYVTVITVALKDKIFTGVLDKFLKTSLSKEEKIKKLHKLYDEHIPKTKVVKENGKMVEKPSIRYDIKEREIEIFDSEIELIKGAMVKVHEWQPDILAAWNIDFDIPRLAERITVNKADPADIFSDPSLPKHLRHFSYKKGRTVKKMSSGKESPIDASEQWHTVTCSASFYVLDAMCTYRTIRTGGPTLPGGYGLDNTLRKETKQSKLKFKDIEEKHGAEFHIYMSKYFPFEYVIYNQWDVLGMIELEKKNQDLSVNLPMLNGVSDFKNAKSGPNQIVDELYFHQLERGYIIGTKDPMLNDDKILGLGKWIVTLEAFRIINNGLRVIAEDDSLITNIRGNVFDIDAVASYPSNGQAANISKETTKREIIDIEGIEKEMFKLLNINSLSGAVNAVEYCTKMYNMPTIERFQELYRESKKEEATVGGNQLKELSDKYKEEKYNTIKKQQEEMMVA